jgi:hypothetical protein
MAQRKCGFELGDLAKDTITGIQGVVVAITYWLNGCVRLQLQPREHKEGKPAEPCGFDVEQVELVERGVVFGPAKQSGGPKPDPRRPEAR